jgi:hypothetical protein
VPWPASPVNHVLRSKHLRLDSCALYWRLDTAARHRGLTAPSHPLGGGHSRAAQPSPALSHLHHKFWIVFLRIQIPFSSLTQRLTLFDQQRPLARSNLPRPLPLPPSTAFSPSRPCPLLRGRRLPRPRYLPQAARHAPRCRVCTPTIGTRWTRPTRTSLATTMTRWWL